MLIMLYLTSESRWHFLNLFLSAITNYVLMLVMIHFTSESGWHFTNLFMSAISIYILMLNNGSLCYI
jgi:hypothetical protein